MASIEVNGMDAVEFKGIIIDIDYVIDDGTAVIRFLLKGKDGALHVFFDRNFLPYFYLVPSEIGVTAKDVLALSANDNGVEVKPVRVEERKMLLMGKEVRAFAIYAKQPKYIPKLKEAAEILGECFEYDIVFWKRYIIDKGIIPLNENIVKAHKDGGEMVVDSIESLADESGVPLTHVSFDIETYNPAGIPRPSTDPVIMISYASSLKSEVLTTKKIAKDFVATFESERAMLAGFSNIIKNIDPDIIVGYNSSNFDLPYILERSRRNGLRFEIGRFDGEEIKKEHHGLIEAVKIPGRINFDVYNVARFVSVVGASEQLIKVNNLTLSEVYHAITGKRKKSVERKDIWKIWQDPKEIEELAEYSLGDSLSLDELYRFFLPLMVEVAKVAGTTLSEASISTTGQLVEHLLMRYAHMNSQIIPNKPSEGEIASRQETQIEGAYVKMPDAGIYENIAVLDFRSLYPSIIIAHNIDPSTICDRECSNYYESPIGVRFSKDRKGIIPTILEMLINERSEIKKEYKKNPDNKTLAARSQALKIIANSFYGYLGYARSRWYSKECAASTTAFGREFIKSTISKAEEAGFKVIYTDTDSLIMLLGNKSKDDAMSFLKSVNESLPRSMELELEDFYTRGVFVSKSVGTGGAKKKYALISESGRIKIRGFELVRRDWAKIARDTQKAVLEAILKDGSKEKAAALVKEAIAEIRKGTVPLSEFVIHTQLRKGINSYDINAPEVAAAKKAIAKGIKRRDELEGVSIGYVITKHGNSISEKAEIEDVAKDYDPEYYIDNQVMPAVMRILRELGYDAEELKEGGLQKKL
ncbi:MAG: DNA-directed DNA polymerase [Candidatus Micrarchaeaceae archaeon]